jgi:hypothetical protein
MPGGKGKSSGGKSSGGKTSAEGAKKQQSHSARAGLQVSRILVAVPWPWFCAHPDRVDRHLNKIDPISKPRRVLSRNHCPSPGSGRRASRWVFWGLVGRV